MAENKEDLKANLIKEAETLGIKIPRTTIAGFKAKKPQDLEKEKVRIEKNLLKWLQTMITKAKAIAKLKPIEKRRAVLVARLKAVKSQARAHTYTDVILRSWIEELDMIDRNPKSWNTATVKGTKPYIPASKRKKTAKDILDGMDLE